MKQTGNFPQKHLLVSARAAHIFVFLILVLSAPSCSIIANSGNASQAAQNTVEPLQPTATLPPTPSLTPTVSPTATPKPGKPTTTPFPDILKGEYPASAAVYMLPLTLRHIEEDRAVLFFELSEPGEGYLLYQEIAPEQAETRSIALPTGETRHQIVLDDLQPDAEYLAVVGLKDATGFLTQPTFSGKIWGSLRFKTLSGQLPLRVGAFGDASFGDPATKALVQQVAKEDLDFVIILGDMVAEIHENSGPFEAYALKFYQSLFPLLHSLPVYTVPGNHDYDSAARWLDSYFYYYAFPPFPNSLFNAGATPATHQYYAIGYHGIQFMMLDSQAIYGVGGREAQNAWVAERLADPRFRYTIPVFHVAAFFSGSVHPEDQNPIRQSWHHLFTSARVPLVLSGHSHHYERLAADGITYIVSGGGSGITYAPGEILTYSQVFARRTHFVLLEIYSDRLELFAIDKSGELFDQVIIPLP